MRPSMQWLIPALAIALLGLSPQPSAHAGGTDYYRMDENAIRHFHRAQMWMEIGQYPAAIKELQIAIQLKPSGAFLATLYNNLGLAYRKLGNTALAVVSFQKAIDLQPGYGLYYDNLARTYQQAGTLDTAITQLRQSVSVNADAPQSWYLLGKLYTELGDTDAARVAFETYLQQAPHSELTQQAERYLEHDNGSQNGIR